MQEQQEQPIDFKWHPEAKIELTPEEFELLINPLKMFEWAISVANMKKDQAIIEKKFLPVYMKDVQTNEKGQILAGADRKPLLKNEEEFFQKTQEKKSIILTNN